MSNFVPSCFNCKLTSPFELVHGRKPDPHTWFEPFSIITFLHGKDVTVKWSQHQSQTLCGVAIGRDSLSNTIQFYNAITHLYYSPGTYSLEKSCLPSTLFPKEIVYDGGMIEGLHPNQQDPKPGPYPPGLCLTFPATADVT